MVTHWISLLVLAFAVSLDGFGVGVTYGLRRIRIPLLSVAIIACFSGLVVLIAMQAGRVLSGWLPPEGARIIGACLLIGIGLFALVQLRRSRAEAGEMEADAGLIEAEAGVNAAKAGLIEAEAGVNAAEALGNAADRRTVAADRTWHGPVVTLARIELKRLGFVVQILRTPQAADRDRSGIISPSEALLLGTALSLDAFGAGLGAALIGFEPIAAAALVAAASGIFLRLGMRFGFRCSWLGASGKLAALPGFILIAMGMIKLF